MPVELKELIIKATVDPGRAGISPANNDKTDSAGISEEVRGQIIQECVETILEVLKERIQR